MKIIIAGGSGFIGNNLVKKLNIEYFVTSIGLRNVEWKQSITNEANVFINLVGKAHDHKGIATEEDFYFANVELAKQIFETFMNSGAELLIHISSLAAVEEIEAVKPIQEDQKSNSVSNYGKSKRRAEEWLLEQKLPENKKLIIIRPPMVHGEGDKGNLKNLYRLISKGIPYPLSWYDNQRSFISVDNFCFFINEIIKNKDKMQSGIYHIADDESVSTKDIIAIINKVENKKNIDLSLPPFFVNTIASIGDYVSFFPINSIRLKKMTSTLLVSNQKIKLALGIDKLPLSAKEGLEKTIRSFKNNPQ